jgi:RNA recognition motif-containing protein
MELYVSNLSFDVSDAEFRDAFMQIGEVRRATLVKDRETGQSRGFGFVEMPDADGQRAIDKLNGFSLQGREMRVSEARPRGDRPAAGAPRENNYRPTQGQSSSHEGGYRPSPRPTAQAPSGGFGSTSPGGYRPTPRPPVPPANVPVVAPLDFEVEEEDRPPRRQIKTKEKPKSNKSFGKKGKRKPSSFEDGMSPKGVKGKSASRKPIIRLEEEDDDLDFDLF